MILFLHAALFVVLSSFNPASIISLFHASFHLRFECPLFLFPIYNKNTENFYGTKSSDHLAKSNPFTNSKSSTSTSSRVPTVMEKHGKKSCHGKSWKSHRKWAKKVVMEIQKGHGKVMEKSWNFSTAYRESRMMNSDNSI